ncbi:MAG: type II and III secretion system protein family protein [Nitrospira sp.]|nr:type II and III secretion system protein family protein [Nitrospira sp.]MDH4369623.1 type II and III secretion system protein family protein [Nitrospira sp.]MDH5497142.1 type II and III secretion system protein family protein [Nitrospira sp.]
MKLRNAITIMGCALTLLAETQAFGQASVTGAAEQRDIQKLELTMGKSKVLDLPVAIKRASLANPEVADTVVLSPTQIYLTGKTIGVTNVTLWNESGKMMGMYDVVIVPDVTRLKENLHKTLPEENGILVTSDHDHITLSGTASNANNLNRALSMAEAYAPKKIVNAMQVGGVQQVMLEVRVAEMNRELIRRLGVNFTGIGNDFFGLSVLGNLTSIAGLAYTGGTPALASGVTQAIQGAFGFNAGGTTWIGFVDALKEENLLKVLAKPTLMALNGQEAAFLAGGEFPIPVPQAFGLVTIQFKKFGVGLVFTPNVLDRKHISLNVAPEVSELDFSNALRTQGFTVPAISTRRAATTIELADGQSFAIGGLLRDNVRESVKKVPFLGEIPILGALFRSSSFQKSETELVIIVTPHLVKPLDMTAQTLPTDYYVEPNDFEFYVMGFSEKGYFGGKAGQRSPAAEMLSNRISTGSAMEGRVGHLMP